MDTLTDLQRQQLFEVLEARFNKFTHRHPTVEWAKVEQLLQQNEQLLATVFEMERTEGEPDVVELEAGVFYIDCAAETPKGRKSVCYDDEALASRKQHKPAASAVGLAKQIGVQLLTEQQYRELQTIEPFDQKTSSWIQTPEAIRKLGGALFCDRRYNTVFLYHNGAESYYSSRAFRGALQLKDF